MNHMAKALFVSLMVCGLAFAQGVRTSTYYNYPPITGDPVDSVFNGLRSIRGSAYHLNPEKDGKSAIAVTNYADNGRVHVFVTVGNDSIQLVWTSPKPAAAGGGSTPRYVLFGDLDNDGRTEVLFQSNGNGIFNFEHDGVPGSHNYGTAPSQIIADGVFPSTLGFAEFMETRDIDGDGQNELLVAYRPGASASQGYFVISAVGEWSTNDPGFSSFTGEFVGLRPNLAPWGLNGGSAWSMTSAQLNGTGNREIVLQAFDRKAITVMTVPSADTYQMADTTNGKAFLRLGGSDDLVARFAGFAFDIDGDGREEVYLPTTSDSPTHERFGTVDMISFDVGQSVTEIDESNVSLLDFRDLIGTKSIFGFGYGDIDGNGKPNLYFTTTYPHTVVSAEFQGGNKKNPASWVMSVLYPGEADIYESITIRDSAGVVDTTNITRNTAFASKIIAQYTDFDGDGLEDLVLPFQAINDSTTIVRRTWNSTTQTYDEVSSKIVNPKRWGLRIIERSPTTGIDVKDITVIMPEDFILEQNYPNPFNPSTTIRFTLPVRERISIRIFDMLGKEIRTLVNNQDQSAGTGEVVWDGRNNRGEQVASGTYFYTLFFGNFQKSQKMILMK